MSPHAPLLFNNVLLRHSSCDRIFSQRILHTQKTTNYSSEQTSLRSIDDDDDDEEEKPQGAS